MSTNKIRSYLAMACAEAGFNEIQLPKGSIKFWFDKAAELNCVPAEYADLDISQLGSLASKRRCARRHHQKHKQRRNARRMKRYHESKTK